MPGTDRYRSRYRDSRYRDRNRQPQQQHNDAVVVALTVQVLVCVLLLLAANLLKKADESKYASVRQEYHVMVTDPAQNEQALAYFASQEGILTQFFSLVENGINAIVAKFGGATSLPEQPEIHLEEEDVFQFDYEYLNRQDVVLTPVNNTNQYGQGGAFPVDLAGLNSKRAQAPAGSVLSPVVVSGNIFPPVTGLVTSAFAYRTHPISGNSDFHTGMDIASPEGTPILSAFPGKVIDAGWSDIYGNYITVEHAGNFQTFYAHCSELIATEGMNVRQGERIAKVGQSGTATGPHLHFSVIVDDQFTDPYWVLKDNIQLVE